MTNKEAVLKTLEKYTYSGIENSYLYGIKIEEFKTQKELKTLAYWALTQYKELINNGY